VRFGLTLAVLLLPKILAAVLTLATANAPPIRWSRAAVRKHAVEQLFSMLLAPSMMLFHSTFVAQICWAKRCPGMASSRADRGVTLREAFRRQKWHLAFALAWGAIMLRWLRAFLVADAVLGRLICVYGLLPDESHQRRKDARRWGLFLIPEETAPAA